MAFGGSLYGGSFTTNCLDDIPFKIGPKFKPPTKTSFLMESIATREREEIVLPPELRVSSQSSALNADYTFEVEEAVIKWSAEREKQLAEQQRLEQEKSESVCPEENNEDRNNVSDVTDRELRYENQTKVSEPVYENTVMLLPKPAPRPGMKPKPKVGYANVLVPNPLIANISGDILMPIQSSSSSENSEISSSDTKPGSKSNDLDLTWFEKEDDPFNNLELQTINDMEELASVLEETKKASPEPPVVQGEFSVCSAENVVNETKIEQIHNGTNEHESDDDLHNYENVELKLVDLKLDANEPVGQGAGSSMTDIMNLPPVPPRRDLLGRTPPPLPPIRHSSSEPTDFQNVKQSMNSVTEQVNEQNKISLNHSFQNDEKNNVISKRRVALPKPPRSFTYSRHDLDDDSDTDKAGEPNYENIQPKVSIDILGQNMNVQFTNASNYKIPDVQSKGNSCEDLNFDHQHFGEESGGGGINGGARPRPAPRKPLIPKPPQPLNRYSPLPPTTGSVHEQAFSQPATSAQPTTSAHGKQTDLYDRLSTEAQGTVDKLASMGFPKETVARAVEKIGLNEKEVVEYLCLLDQVMEKGYSTYLAENALLMFKNSIQQACAYLELYTQLQELGFNGDKIKEALIDTNNDREKTLDILTASS